jgi:hypothetical protein
LGRIWVRDFVLNSHIDEVARTGNEEATQRDVDIQVLNMKVEPSVRVTRPGSELMIRAKRRWHIFWWLFTYQF